MKEYEAFESYLSRARALTSRLVASFWLNVDPQTFLKLGQAFRSWPKGMLKLQLQVLHSGLHHSLASLSS
jgi:hypothetical protein